MNNNLVSPMDLSKDDLNQILILAKEIKSNPQKFAKVCEGKILGSLFFEPSTRTRFSFESAMMKLGGNILGFSEPNSSSTAKGESLADTIKMVSIYADIIAMRHPLEGSAKVASMYSKVPLINAGDGAHHHPTQMLTDILTIDSLKGRLDNLTIGVCGDLLNGRTVISLITTMSKYENNKFVLISPPELKVPQHIKIMLNKNNISFEEVCNLEENIEKLDLLYMTRIQKERFSSEVEYLKLKDSYILDNEKLVNAKKDMIIMHPLPRVNEIKIEVDNDERAKYFEQAEYGMYARMALIIKLLENYNSNSKLKCDKNTKVSEDVRCTNRKCITNEELYIENEFELVDEEENIYSCVYCDNLIILD